MRKLILALILVGLGTGLTNIASADECHFEYRRVNAEKPIHHGLNNLFEALGGANGDSHLVCLKITPPNPHICHIALSNGGKFENANLLATTSEDGDHCEVTLTLAAAAVDHNDGGLSHEGQDPVLTQ